MCTYFSLDLQIIAIALKYVRIHIEWRIAYTQVYHCVKVVHHNRTEMIQFEYIVLIRGPVHMFRLLCVHKF